MGALRWTEDQVWVRCIDPIRREGFVCGVGRPRFDVGERHKLVSAES
jgi:hypothetical protein